MAAQTETLEGPRLPSVFRPVILGAAVSGGELVDCGHCGFWVTFVSAAVSGVSPGGSERDTQS